MSLPGFTAETAVEDNEAEGLSKNVMARYRIGIPGMTSGEVGLGNVISRTAAAVGIRPCGGCGGRARALNSWIAFSPRR